MANQDDQKLQLLEESVSVEKERVLIGHVRVSYPLDKSPELLFAFLERFFRHLSLRQVAGDLRKDQKPTVRVDDDVGPEGSAVLADPPAFRFEAPFCLGDRKRALGALKVLPDRQRAGNQEYGLTFDGDSNVTLCSPADREISKYRLGGREDALIPNRNFPYAVACVALLHAADQNMVPHPFAAGPETAMGRAIFRNRMH